MALVNVSVLRSNMSELFPLPMNVGDVLFPKLPSGYLNHDHKLEVGSYLLPLALFTVIAYCTVRTVLLPPLAKSRAQSKPMQGPQVPYTIVSFGGILLSLLRNPVEFLLNARYFSNYPHPIRVRFPFKDIYFNQGPANVAALFQDKSLSAFFLHPQFLSSFFGMSKEATDVYRADNSGTHATPYPGTNVEARNRVDHRTFIWFHKFLIGTGFAPLCQRFERGLARHLLPFQSTRMRDWVHGDDLMQMFKQSLLSPAVTDAIFGRTLLDRHPHVLEEIWRLDDNLWRLGSRLPKFIFPGAHNTLRKCTAAVKDWHAYAMTQAKSSGPREISENEDAFFSSEFVQSRREFFQTIDGQDEGSMISEDVALLWASNHNTSISVFWLILDVFRTPSILAHIRREAQACLISHPSDASPKFDMNRLQRLPYVQAAYAETLRLRTHGTIIRRPREDMDINGWNFPKNATIVIPSTTAHMNADVWASEERGCWSPREFHPERFLIYRNGSAEPDFTMSGTEGSWIPFAGGVRECPGRRFVKYATIMTLATFVTMFDLEVLADEKELEMGNRRFGFGVLEPRGKIRYQFRCRAQS